MRTCTCAIDACTDYFPDTSVPYHLHLTCISKVWTRRSPYSETENTTKLLIGIWNLGMPSTDGLRQSRHVCLRDPEHFCHWVFQPDACLRSYVPNFCAVPVGAYPMQQR